MRDDYKVLYNILVDKINEIIDTLEELEKFDDLCYKDLNVYLQDIIDKISTGGNIDIDIMNKLVEDIDNEITFIKGKLGE